MAPKPHSDAMLIIAPCPLSFIDGNTARQPFTAPMKLTSNADLKSASLSCKNSELPPPTPALFTKMSTGP